MLSPATAATSINTMDTEKFIDVIRSIGSVVLPVAINGLQVATPFLGTLGESASAITGIALNALSKATESSSNTGTKSGLLTGISPIDLEGCAERAILAESALQTAFKIDSTTPLGQQVLKDMAEIYVSLVPLEALHSKVFFATAGPIIRIALNNSIKPTPTEANIRARKDLLNSTSAESFDNESYAAFASALLTPTVPVPGTEAFFDQIASTIQKGLNYAAPMLRPVAQQGLVAALSTLPDNGTESSTQILIPDAVMSAPLLQRALVAECALQVVQKIDVATLETLPLYDSQGDHLATENFFDDLKKTMQTIGEPILNVAPDVIKNVGPIALSLVAGPLTNNSAAGGGPNGVSPLQPGPLPKGDSPKPIPIGWLAGRAALKTHARSASGVISLAGLAGSTSPPAGSRMVSHTTLPVVRMKAPMMGVFGLAKGTVEDPKSALLQSENTSATSSWAEVPQYVETVDNFAELRENMDRPIFARAPWEN